MPSDIAPSQGKNDLSGVFSHVAGYLYQIADHSPNPSSSDRVLCGRSMSALYGSLSDDTQDIIRKDRQFYDEFIRFEFTGRKSFDIHIGLDLAVVLFTLTVRMIKIDDLIIRLSEIRPPGIYFDISGEQELPVPVDRSFNNFVADPYADSLRISVSFFVGDILPTASDIHGLAFPGVTDILAAPFDLFKPVLFALAAPQVPFDDEPGTAFEQDSNVLCCVIAGIQSDQELAVSQFTGQSKGLLEEFRCVFLRMLFSFPEFRVDQEAFCSQIGHHRRVAVKALI